MGKDDVTVRTYFKIDDRLVDVYEYSGQLPEEDDTYVDGVIFLRIGSIEVLGPNHWDYVITFWSFIVKGLCEHALRQETTIVFPDQPSSIKFVPAENNRIVIHLDDERKASTDRTILLQALVSEAKRFFNRMKFFFPSQESSYQAVLRDLDSIQI